LTLNLTIFESGQHYDDLIMNLTPENWDELDSIINKLRVHYPKQMFRMFAKTKYFGNSEFDTKFGFYIWNITEDEGFVKIFL
jgi:hypothetical protein